MEAWIPVVLAIVSPFIVGIGWLFKTRRDDRIADKLADQTEIKELRKVIFEMQQDRIKYEVTRRESSDQTMKVLSDMAATMPALQAALLELSNKGMPR